MQSQTPNDWRNWDCNCDFVGVYGLCDGRGLSTGPYLGITTVCSVVSLFFVSVKAAYVFGGNGGGMTELALLVSSPVMAIGHIVVAYRTSCRERRKLLVYKIDIEAVSQFLFLFLLKKTNIDDILYNLFCITYKLNIIKNIKIE